MPVILPLDAWRVWISEDTEPDRAASLLAPYPAEQMSSRPVSTIVNSPAHDSPACIQSDDAPA
jgi:putative SOS response-associated peptidase YedK